MTPMLEKIARAVEETLEALNPNAHSTVGEDQLQAIARAALLAMRDEMKEMRVHTDGYSWKRGNGPFLVWDEVETVLTQPSNPTDVTTA